MTDRLDGRVALVTGASSGLGARWAVMAQVARLFGRLDVVVDNAGVCDGGPLQDQPLADITAVMT